MLRVYVVTSHCPMDYDPNNPAWCVQKVFSNEKAAKAFIETQKDHPSGPWLAIATVVVEIRDGEVWE